MDAKLGALVVTAASLGFIHTVMGPDHYVPFVMMSWARRWSWFKTTLVTVLCGFGHIGSSVVLGLVGVWLGLVLKKLTVVESFRGAIAAWLLIGFGLLYFVWGLRRAYRNRPHEHRHFHRGPQTPSVAFGGPQHNDSPSFSRGQAFFCESRGHTHEHSHHLEHVHVHNGGSPVSIAPWVLFAIFVFGPCEILIPTLMYPAAMGGWFGVAIVTLVFGTVTIATMVGAVLLMRAGVSLVRLGSLERFAHAIAGATICLCGLAVQFGL